MRLTPLCWNSSISCSRHERHRPRRRDEDGAPPIAHAQTVSQPYIVALMTEAAALKSTDKVLEIGTGSGARSSVNCADRTADGLPHHAARALSPSLAEHTVGSLDKGAVPPSRSISASMASLSSEAASDCMPCFADATRRYASNAHRRSRSRFCSSHNVGSRRTSLGRV